MSCIDIKEIIACNEQIENKIFKQLIEYLSKKVETLHNEAHLIQKNLDTLINILNGRNIQKGISVLMEKFDEGNMSINELEQELLVLLNNKHFYE